MTRPPLILGCTFLACARCRCNSEHELRLHAAGWATVPCRCDARCLDCGLTTPTTLPTAGAWLAGVAA